MNTTNNLDIINKIGIKVLLKVDYPIICETLERIGIVNKLEKKIFPSCYCIKYSDIEGTDSYRVCHFKEMFLLQNKESTFNDLDAVRRNTIGYLLQSWNLMEALNQDDIADILSRKITVVPFKEKKEYTIVHKFRNLH
jgi:hypothetical protein